MKTITPQELKGKDLAIYELTKSLVAGDNFFLTMNSFNSGKEVYRAVAKQEGDFLTIRISYKRGLDDVVKYFEIIHELTTAKEVLVIYSNGVFYNE